ncbi:hypothetical protein EDC01DRAFT_361405 [Geopyxis carbonaria]|nr:hypothetical protein EDC01DRAFT_361405 [Geopyxis carbonaria]
MNASLSVVKSPSNAPYPPALLASSHIGAPVHTLRFLSHPEPLPKHHKIYIATMAEVVLGIAGSIAGLITLATSASSLLAGISSTQTRRLAASINDLLPVLCVIRDTLGSQQYNPQSIEIRLLAAPVVALDAVLRRLKDVLQTQPGHWWERRERRETVDALVREIEMAKATMMLAFVVVNWRAFEALRVAMGALVAVLEEQQRLAVHLHSMVLAFMVVNWRTFETLGASMEAVLEGQQQLAARLDGNLDAIGLNGNMPMQEERRLRVEAQADRTMMDVLRLAAARTVLPAACVAFFFDLDMDSFVSTQ